MQKYLQGDDCINDMADYQMTWIMIKIAQALRDADIRPEPLNKTQTQSDTHSTDVPDPIFHHPNGTPNPVLPHQLHESQDHFPLRELLILSRTPYQMNKTYLSAFKYSSTCSQPMTTQQERKMKRLYIAFKPS